MTERVVVFGNTELAELNFFYLSHDSPYTVVAFTVDAAFIAEASFCKLPVVPFETIESAYEPSAHAMSLLIGYRDVNRFRAERYRQAKVKGYRLISYVSSKAITWPGLRLGENAYVYENAVVQPFATIGNDVVIAPGAVIGHHSTVMDHCFVASSAVVLGNVMVEPYSVLGGNCVVADGTTVGRECIVGANAFVAKNSLARSVYVTHPPALLDRCSDEVGGLLTWSSAARARRRDRELTPSAPAEDTRDS